MSLDVSIGVVTPYKAHQELLLAEWKKKHKNSKFDVKFKTVDAFQGQEKDIVIFNCVRASPNQGIGFLKDVRRLNVAITRPRHFLFIVGNSKTISRNKTWKEYV